MDAGGACLLVWEEIWGEQQEGRGKLTWRQFNCGLRWLEASLHETTQCFKLQQIGWGWVGGVLLRGRVNNMNDFTCVCYLNVTLNINCTTNSCTSSNMHVMILWHMSYWSPQCYVETALHGTTRVEILPEATWFLPECSPIGTTQPTTLQTLKKIFTKRETRIRSGDCGHLSCRDVEKVQQISTKYEKR